MKAASLKEVKSELSHKTHNELMELCLRLSRFKKENKELLSYLLFENSNEEAYIESIKSAMDLEFEAINTDSYFYMRKTIRKILRLIKKYIRYSQNKETEVELLLYFANKLKEFNPSIFESKALENLYFRNIDFIKKKVCLLHEDLQYDYRLEIEELE
ncbi:MAG: hypothetical protein L3J09_03095 [Flavobacteriaceae bacterium]|nr:hypothetical protein [Flavobacteriaceae bacterium]